MLMLVVGSYTMVKSVRDAIFLSKFGITELSLIAIGLAVLTSFIVTIYIRATAGVPRNILILGTYGVVAASLFGIWAGLGAESPSSLLPWILYIWSSIFGVFTVMQFWLLANDLFDPREAKRFFGVVGAGAILGGMTGGFLSKGLAAAISTRGLLLIAGAMLVCAAILANIAWPLRRREQKKKRKEKKGAQGGGIAALKESPYLRLLALALFLATVVTTLLDWQFKGIIKAEFVGRTDEMAGFFGALYGYLSVASFGLQLLITGWVLRRFGISVGLLLLPISLLFGSSAILFFGILPISRLTAASGAKVAEGGLRFAIDKASMELMWVPVPPRLKAQGKAFIDTVIDRLGTGVTGILWLVLAYFGLDQDDKIHLISILCLVLTVVWLWVLLRARSAYVGALRQSFADRSLDLQQTRSSFSGAEASKTLAGFLDSQEKGQLHFGLYLLSELPGRLPDLGGVLAHPDPGVRCAALQLAAGRADNRYRGLALAAIGERLPGLRRAALDYLRVTAGIAADPGLQETVPQDPMHGFAISVAKLAIPALAMQAADEIRRFIDEAANKEKLTAIGLLSSAPPQMAAALLAPILLLEGREIRRAAMRSAGRARAVGTVPTLLPLLDQRRWRPWVVTSLSEMGAAGATPLTTALEPNEKLVRSVEAEAAVIRLVGANGDLAAAKRLMSYCSHEVDDRLYGAALRGLVRLRRRVDFDVDKAAVKGLLLAEMRAMAADLLALGRGSWSEMQGIERSDALFERALYDHIQQHGQRVFYLLSLLHDPADMRAAYRGARSPSKTVRASTLEFLDNVLDRNEKRPLMALIEAANAGEFTSAARVAFELHAEDEAVMLQRHIQGQNEWLRAVVVWHVGHNRKIELRSHVAAQVGEVSSLSPSPRFAAVAKRALEELDNPESKEPTMGLTVVEKVLRLQSVDVFEAASTDDLAHVAQIAEEVELAGGEAVYAEGDAPDALYVVLSGEVKLHRGSDEIGQLSAGEAFGSWALLDEAPRVASATTVGPATLLKVEREEFLELLADRVDIVQAVFKAMVDRLRKLAEMNL